MIHAEMQAILVKDFKKEFGGMTCGGLLGIDFSEPGGYQKFQESGIWKDKCYKYIEYVVEKLYELEDGKGKDQAGPIIFSGWYDRGPDNEALGAPAAKGDERPFEAGAPVL